MSFGDILSTLLIGPLKLIFEIIYNLANECIHHPGYSIILLSLAMNILVLPLYRQADTMQERARDTEAKLHDGIAHIKKTFSGDERMMILETYYRQNSYSPLSALSGSVSLLLEIPFFMAAYQFLSGLELLHGVSLGPIADLSQPDGLIQIAGFSINLLPILMTVVNIISSAMYLKGFPLKTKIQLYAMAGFFLVFLYTSPAGLVFYWTLNNVFSLVKTIFYKIKNPKKVLAVLMALAGAAACIFGIFFYQVGWQKRRLFVIGLGVVLFLPLLLPIITNWFPKSKAKAEPKPNRKLFLLGGIFMTVLTGLFIPATFVAASPQEYVDVTYFNHPLWYVASAVCLAAGTFIIWLQVFYKLADDKGKAVFDKGIWILSLVAVVNYMFFGTNLGVLSPTLQYESGMSFAPQELLLNTAVMAVICIIGYIIVKKWAKAAVSLLLVATIALSAMSGLHIVTTTQSVDKIADEQLNGEDKQLNFQLSQNGKNVVVILLDRAMGTYVPYVFNEKPELKEKFDGFTYYDNTISFGGHTNFASAACYGGYEYTPVEINKRKDESLVSKQNEAVTMLPRLFSEHGFISTISDPAYANFGWIPDLSIYDEYPEIRAFNTKGKFGDLTSKKAIMESNKRNFFCFALMKSMPLYFQNTMYNNGMYNQAVSSTNAVGATSQTITSLSTSVGMNPQFNELYNVMTALPHITGISEGEENTFCYLYNDITHRPALLQAPDYVPAGIVDNREYDAAHTDRFTLGDQSIDVTTDAQMSHYHAMVATFLQLGEWFDYMRENGVYENTRIIMVSDHGFDLYQDPNLFNDQTQRNPKDMGRYFPMLMVKDFGSTGFTTSHEFMTNADVPTLAVKDLLENPINPFTGKLINDNEKRAHRQFIIRSNEWELGSTVGNTFVPSTWVSVSGNIWDKNDWQFHETEEIVMDSYPEDSMY